MQLRRSLVPLQLGRVVAAVVVVALFAGAAFAPQAGAYTYITYCSDGWSAPGNACSSPPGWAMDPFGVYDSWGGWDKNFADYYGSGAPDLEVYVQYYPNNVPTDVCTAVNPTSDHINDGGCAARYSWNVGHDVDLLATVNPNACCGHHIYGTGRYP